ncbi:hypothetical protein [Desulfurispira natronophila]|uniref:Uncharacterized protein n=1 Tax=Desulfurispira natronophila TaxID=682562 RepID=A0A7W8DGK2_9BACT|nr:hypothetical protein [Desulfurispira natronophila]MBB5021495.1 hypothetical protein [Desulfurispira natronophila]
MKYLFVVAILSMAVAALVWYRSCFRRNPSECSLFGPEEFATEAAKLYRDGLLFAVKTVHSSHQADEVVRKLIEHKEFLIGKFVELGHQYLKISPQDQEAGQRLLLDKLQDMDAHTWSTYMATLSQYPEFSRQLADYNLITQYAFFDLLWQQLPDEADRLGIPQPLTTRLRQEVGNNEEIVTALAGLNWELSREQEGWNGQSGAVLLNPDRHDTSHGHHLYITWTPREVEAEKYIMVFGWDDWSAELADDRSGFLRKAVLGEHPGIGMVDIPAAMAADGIIRLPSSGQGGGFFLLKLIAVSADGTCWDVNDCTLGSELARRKAGLPEVGYGTFAEVIRIPGARVSGNR